MRPIRAYDIVKVTRLLIPSRPFDGTASVARAPAVGDVATVCHEYQPDKPTAPVAVEMIDADGHTIWLADFERGDLEFVSGDAI